MVDFIGTSLNYAKTLGNFTKIGARAIPTYCILKDRGDEMLNEIGTKQAKLVINPPLLSCGGGFIGYNCQNRESLVNPAPTVN